MEITRLSPDDEVGCAAAVAVMDAAAKVDCPESLLPTPRGYANHLRYGWDLDPARAYLARDAEGTAVGLLSADAPTYDNTNLMWLGIDVHPDYRSHGVGSELIAYAEALAAELGRSSLGASSWDLPKSEAFAQRHGFERKSIAVNRRQDIANLDWSVVQKLYDDAVAASSAYELLKITGSLPEELLEGMVTVTDSINDAPKDDLDIEDDAYSPERLRAYEEAQLKSDRTLYRVIAREKATGELAGHSTITVELERPHIGEQNDTAVSRDHRGHRLGALLKSAMLLWMRDQEPALTQIDTWNAESNNHMIAINEQLNYRIIARALEFQKSR
ncbi:GNAT family N-acetyltransferase [Kribbella sp. NPDC049174]|uniref:GNAT family N-acetyltransferase n=1 Tax=Kribbella sp. NPDC049174 TaxID=3364112 RepID=UPI00371F4059